MYVTIFCFYHTFCIKRIKSYITNNAIEPFDYNAKLLLIKNYTQLKNIY